MKQDYETKPLGQDDGDETANSSKEDSDETEQSEEAGANESESEGTTVESEESEEDLSEDEDADYETELKAERERLGKKIDKEREKRIKAERAQGLSEVQIQEIVRKEVAQTEKRVLSERANELADRLAKSDAERELIIHHYNNSIVSSGNLEEDIEKAYALANRKKFNATISELRAAARSKKTRTGSSSGGAPQTTKKPVKFSQSDIDGAEFAGVTIEEFVKKKNER